MVGMRPEEAREFYEEDEDPAKVIALFDAAERKGQLKRTGPPPDPPPMRELGDQFRRLVLELRLRERIAKALRSLFATREQRGKAH